MLEWSRDYQERSDLTFRTELELLPFLGLKRHHHPNRDGGAREQAILLPRAALRVLQLRLAPLGRLALRFADDEGAATHVFGFVEFVVCHVDFSLA
jgi:hypothetical protein